MPWVVYAVCAAGLAIIYLLPLATKIVPSPLVAIVVLTIACVWLGLDIRTVGDMGELPDSLPVFLFPDIPWTLETLRIVLPVSATRSEKSRVGKVCVSTCSLRWPPFH